MRSRRPGVWELRVALPPDPATGRRRQRSVTVYGTRGTASAELARLVNETAPSPGDRCAATTMTFGELLDLWWDPKRPTLAASTAR